MAAGTAAGASQRHPRLDPQVRRHHDDQPDAHRRHSLDATAPALPQRCAGHEVPRGGRQPSTPSPTGLFYVTDHIATGQPGGAYGPYALGLSGFSNVLFSFAGSDGVVGIHGTNETSSVGHAVTHGCIRLYNRDITKLYSKVWIGTPVVVQ